MAHSPYFIVEIIGVVIAFISVLYLYVKYVLYNYWSSKNIDYVEPVVPLGSLGPVAAGKISMGAFVRDKYLEYRKSPVFGFYSFHKATLVVNDPDLIRIVLTKSFANFHDRGIYCDVEADPLSGHLFMLPGARWRYLRTKLTPTFTATKMKHMFFTVKECADTLAVCLENIVEKSGIFETKELISRFSTDVIASAAFGIECNSLENPDVEFRKWGRKIFEPKPLTTALALLAPQLLKVLRFLGSNNNDVNDFFIKVFKETAAYRTANNVVRKDFMDLLMQLMNKGSVQDSEGKESGNVTEANSERITMLEAAAQAFAFWLAGFDTSSTTVTNCVYELAIHQDIQDKVSDEVNSVLNEFGDLTYESLTKMTYLQKVVSETLRKYPSVPMLNRECTEEIDLPGVSFRIAKGTPIIIPVFGLHMNPDFYPDPEIFDPERFTEENIKSRHQYAYLPFGEGPRNCIGMRFGLVQSKVAIVKLVSKYRLTLGPGVKVPMQLERGSFVTGPEGGLPIRIERR